MSSASQKQLESLLKLLPDVCKRLEFLTADISRLIDVMYLIAGLLAVLVIVMVVRR